LSVELVNPVTSTLSEAELLSFFARHSSANPVAATIASLRLMKRLRVEDVRIGELLSLATVYEPTLRLKTLDMLHLMAAIELGSRRFFTLSEEIVSKRELILRELGIEVVTP
jgi:predicted nucleic acid-binding protein